ncbi:MAG: hypothetical protein H6711_21825 [Myxococcales bacterium]|nr:hypothetical protein [Myxococcales bacterium]
MSYQYTDVLIYGVAVSCEEARALLVELGAAAFEAQRAVDFAGIKREWEVASWSLEAGHDDLAAGFSADVEPCARCSELADFYDLLGFLPFLTPAAEVETITWSGPRGRTYSRTRYHVDLVCEGADARRDDSKRLLEGHTSYFGVVLGSHGYGYRDDLERLAAENDPRIARNFERYCRPALVARGWERAPALREVGQIW